MTARQANPSRRRAMHGLSEEGRARLAALVAKVGMRKAATELRTSEWLLSELRSGGFATRAAVERIEAGLAEVRT